MVAQSPPSHCGKGSPWWYGGGGALLEPQASLGQLGLGAGVPFDPDQTPRHQKVKWSAQELGIRARSQMSFVLPGASWVRRAVLL